MLKPSAHFPFNYTKILLWSESPSKANVHLAQTEGADTLPALRGQTLSWALPPLLGEPDTGEHSLLPAAEEVTLAIRRGIL